MRLCLDGSLATGGGSHKLCPAHLAQAVGKQLCTAGGILVHQHHHGTVHGIVIAGAQQGFLSFLVLSKGDGSFRHQHINGIDCHFQQTTLIVPQVKHIGFCSTLIQIIHCTAQLSLGGAVKAENLHIAIAVLQHLVLHAGDAVLAPVQGEIRGSTIQRHVGDGNGSTCFSPQTSGYVGGGKTFYFRTVNGSDKAAHFQTQIRSRACLVHLGNPGVARGILHHFHTNAQQLAVLDVHQFRILLCAVIAGIGIPNAHHVAMANHVVQGSILNIAIVVGTYILINFRQLAVHGFLLLDGGNGAVKHLTG